MKKYLSLAALLGLIAFVSVSYLAQAQIGLEEKAAQSADTLENINEDALSPDLVRFMENAEACETELAQQSEDITQEEHNVAFVSCMTARGHDAQEVKMRYFDTQPAMPDVQ